MLSSSLSFGKNRRLLTRQDYQRVFDHVAFRFSNPHLLLLVACRNPDQPARLGLIVGKKHVKRAVGRNRIKRVWRELFRTHCQTLQGYEIIAMARPGIRQLDLRDLYRLSQPLWEELVHRLPTADTDNACP